MAGRLEAWRRGAMGQHTILKPGRLVETSAQQGSHGIAKQQRAARHSPCRPARQRHSPPRTCADVKANLGDELFPVEELAYISHACNCTRGFAACRHLQFCTRPASDAASLAAAGALGSDPAGEGGGCPGRAPTCVRVPDPRDAGRQPGVRLIGLAPRADVVDDARPRLPERHLRGAERLGFLRAWGERRLGDHCEGAGRPQAGRAQGRRGGEGRGSAGP